MYKIKKQYILSKAVMMITGIILFGFMGISYAAWSDDLEISSAISIGKIEPKFSGNYIRSLSTEKGSINFDGTRTQADLGELVLYEGEEISLSLHINNEGTMPIKSEGVTINQSGVSIQIQGHVIEPEDSVDITLSITALEPGEYDFNTNQIKILYKQNTPDESWEKELYVKGKIVVDELLLEESLKLEEVEGLENGLELEETFPETVGVEPEVEESLSQVNDTNLEVEETGLKGENGLGVKDIQSDPEKISQGVME